MESRHLPSVSFLPSSRMQSHAEEEEESCILQVLPESTNEQNLSSWLGYQCKLLKKGLLSSARAAQLLALGVKPDDKT